MAGIKKAVGRPKTTEGYANTITLSVKVSEMLVRMIEKERLTRKRVAGEKITTPQLIRNLLKRGIFASQAERKRLKHKDAICEACGQIRQR